jgi:tetratricopeptide (TPR) repeat protein
MNTSSQPSTIELLTRSIRRYPDAPGNYLLRGEEWLARGFLEEARDDFFTARTYAEEQLSQSAWGYIFQAYIDRAELGLTQCGTVNETLVYKL